MGRTLKDLTGKTFNRLTAQWPAGLRGAHVCWLTLCVCGNLKVVKGTHLTSALVQSCGCLRVECGKEKAALNFPEHVKHGHAFHGRITRTYRTWDSMRQRCLNPRDKKYKDYGGRGILICARWLESFSKFLEDMGEKPIGLSIDRINNDGNYESSNCRWATPLQQRHNQRRIM